MMRNYNTNEVLIDLLTCKLDVSPTKLFLKLEATVRKEQEYLRARLALAAAGYDVYDKIIYEPGEGQKNGYVQFACIKAEKVEYVKMEFRYVQGGLLNLIRIEFSDPYPFNPITVRVDPEDNDDEGFSV